MSKIDELLKNEKVEWKKLGEIGYFFGGLTGKTKEDFGTGNSKYVPYKNIFSNIEVDLNNLESVNIGNEKQNELRIGDILFTGSSEIMEECGLSSVITEEISGIYLNSFSFAFRLNDDVKILPSFSKYLFRDFRIRKQIIKTANGVTRFNVSKEAMKKIEIPIPSIETQEKIVKTLDKFTNYVNELQAELQAELQSRTKQYEYYRDMLLSEEYLNKISKEINGHGKGYEVKFTTLGEIGEIQMCKRILKEQTSSQGEVPFYKIGTFGKEADSFISQGLFREYREKYNYPKNGEILISASGTIGKTVIFDGKDAYFQDSNIVWISHNERLVLNKYLYYFYQIVKWNPSTGGTINRLYNYNLKNIKITLPPIEIQNKIVEILDKFQSLLADTKGLLPQEIEQRQKQYEYYRKKLLTFDENSVKREREREHISLIRI